MSDNTISSDHDARPIAGNLFHLPRKPKYTGHNHLLSLSISKRLALGFFLPILVILGSLTAIGWQSYQLLTNVSDFNQSLIHASTSLTTGLTVLQQTHTNLLGEVNDASKPETRPETLQEDSKSIQHLAENYYATLQTYLKQDDPVNNPELLSLLEEAGHGDQARELHMEAIEAQKNWQSYQRVLTEIDAAIRVQNLDQAQTLMGTQAEQEYAEAITSLLILIQSTNDLAPAIHDTSMIQENQLLLTMAILVLCLIIGAGIMGWLVSSTLVKRLRRFQAVVKSVKQGQFEARVEVDGRDEIAQAAQAVNTTLDAIVGLLDETRQQRDELAKGEELKRLHVVLQDEKQALKEANERLEALATTDMLTSLPNHRALQQLLESECERARRFGHPLSLLFFDGDRFKRVNDTYGHSVGDVVLRELGARAKSVLRAGDTIGRFGGEEFLVLLPETDAEEARLVAERLRNAVATAPLATQEVEGGIAVTVSIGLASYPNDGMGASEIRERADQAMYWAKRLGRNQIRTSEEAIRAERDATLKAATAHALDRQELHELAARDGSTPENMVRIEQLGLIYSLMGALDVREPGMSEHAHEVGDLVAGMARLLNFDQERIFRISTAGFLHDIGKIALPDQLLQKPRQQFSDQEWRLMHQHAELGAEIVSASPWLAELAPAIRHHHERWDGSGTPDGLKGKEIPLEARMITVAEAYHAMISDKPYQGHRPVAEVLKELKQRAGSQFDPALVSVLIEVLESRSEGEGAVWESTSSDLLSQV